MKPRTWKMDGYRLHTVKTKQFKTTTMMVKFRAPLDEERVTSRALLPYVLQSSTAKWPTTAAFRKHLDDLYGASAQVDVAKKGESHVLTFTVDVANERFIHGVDSLSTDALHVLTEQLFNPLVENGAFSAKVVDQEKRSLRQRLTGIRDDKMRYASQRLVEEMCEGEKFALQAAGRLEDLDAITPESLYETYNAMLSGDTVDVYIVGDLDEDAIAKAVEESFPLKARTRLDSEKGMSVEREPKEVVEKQAIKQGKLNIGYRTDTVYGDDDYMPMVVMNGILGGFPHSKLFVNVREKESLAYYAASRIESHKGLLIVMSGVDPGKIERADTIIQEQLTAIRNGEISDKEFAQTKAVLRNQMLETLDVARGIIEVLYQSEVAAKPVAPKEWFERLEAVTVDQVIAAAKKVRLDTTYVLTSEGGVA